MATLMITQRFPPHAGAAARRLAHLAQIFAREGEVFVIRSGADGADDPAVTATFNLPRQDLRQLSAGTGSTVDARTKQRPLVRALLRLRQAYPFVYLTDDGGPAYRKKALALAVELVETRQVDTIFSSFRPWTDHLVARQLKQQFPELKWVADFRDLPVDLVRNDVWFPALQRWWGKRILADATEVWTVSEGQKAQLAGWHPNLRVRYNALLSLPPERSAPVSDRFTIAYTGSLYPHLQTMDALVNALRELITEGQIPPDKVCLQYRGKEAGVFESWTRGLPPHCLDVKPSIAPAAAQKMQYTATILLLLNWSASGYYGVLTAKLWDYLATGRPILALVNGPGDQELKDIILGADAGAVFETKEQGAVKAWLLTQYQRWETEGVLPWQPNREALKRYLT
ncbi:MAG: hypothetical protein ACI81P_002887 [Neolewinella sp.]|jgi:hypothetical protein